MVTRSQILTGSIITCFRPAEMERGFVPSRLTAL